MPDNNYLNLDFIKGRNKDLKWSFDFSGRLSGKGGESK